MTSNDKLFVLYVAGFCDASVEVRSGHNFFSLPENMCLDLDEWTTKINKETKEHM